MRTDKLKLNDDKTEFMLTGTKQQLSKVNIDCLTVGSIDVALITVARNLGTWFDSNLNRIRKYLSQESARTLLAGLILKYPSLKLKKTLGDRAFSSAAPNTWNNLPLHIRLEDNFECFKSLLKTHLFRLAFDM
ncbi:unnamed protein product [Porites lobata]|uniref:Uncharacterized protein n=1 Tax=Porites lobata TaxID=104759 RepID=A0ABN8NR42_9CNID|nr:unnamed protein product [Porites lobata]